MPMCLECGEVPEPENKRYCPECGIHFPSALHDGSTPEERECIVCATNVPHYVRVCKDCYRAGRFPSQCPQCLTAPTLGPGKVSHVGSGAKCPECSYSFVLPPALAEVVSQRHSSHAHNTSLGQTDLEWLFFAVVRYQQDEFGGQSLVVTMSDEGLEIFEQYSDVESNEYSDISWPHPLLSEQKSDLLDLLERYEQHPPLWVGDIEYEEGTFIEIWPGFTFDIPELASDDVRTALITELDRGDFSGLNWLAPVVAQMLKPEPYFR